MLAVVPLRAFDTAKTRLDPAVSPEARSRIAAALAERVVAACRDSGWRVVVVTGAEEVSAWCDTHGVPTVSDPGMGLDAAAAAGVAGAAGPWMVVHGDLPLITPEDLVGVATAAAAGHTVLAPARDGGTNVIAAVSPIRFAYGAGSFVRHLAINPAPHLVIIRAGLAVELDTSADLTAVLGHPRGRWLGSLLS